VRVAALDSFAFKERSSPVDEVWLGCVRETPEAGLVREGRCEYCGARTDQDRLQCELCGAPVLAAVGLASPPAPDDAAPQPQSDVAGPVTPESQPRPRPLVVPVRRPVSPGAATDLALAAARSAEKSFRGIAIMMYAMALCGDLILVMDRQSSLSEIWVPWVSLAIAVPLSFMAYGQRKVAARILADRSRLTHEDF